MEIEIKLIDLKGESPASVIDDMGGYLETLGLVNHDYILALQDREKNFPTGLRVNNSIAVAIPHAREGTINSSVICVGLPLRKVRFRLMDNPDEDSVVDVVMVMAIRKPEEHLQILKKLVGAIQSTEFIGFVNARDKEGIMTLLESITAKGESGS